jgi:hypothetical protein
MRTTLHRIAWIAAAALAAACGETPKDESGPLDRLYRPTGLAVHEGRLLVVSSNGDLLYDDDTGGTLIALDLSTPSTEPAGIDGALAVRSFGGDLAVADAVSCPTTPLAADPRAIFATRGSNALYAASIGPDGSLSCAGCEVPLSGPFSDPFAVGVACGGGRARAFVGHLRSVSGEAWITEYDLETGVQRSMSVGAGPIRAFAYDAARDRLYLLGLATGSPTPLRWVELGGCTIGASGPGGCSVYQASLPSVSSGIELRGMAFAPARDGEPQRVYLTGRLYDTSAAAIAGGRVNDLGGALLVVDLVENARGGVDLQLVEGHDIGRGAQDVRVLPSPDPDRRDIVAALTVDDAVLWIYDDRTGALTQFGRDPITGEPLGEPGGRDPATGAPVLGHEPFGLAVDPDPIDTVARVYVGSYRESFVTPIDVPLDAPEDAHFTGLAGAARRISGGTP